MDAKCNIDRKKQQRELTKGPMEVIIDEHNDPPHEKKGRREIQYGIDDCPPWYLTIFFGFQHYLIMFAGSVTVPLIVTPAMCIGDDDVGKGEVISTVMFVEGIATLLQATFGTRLPIIQGLSFSFLAPIFAVLALPKWKCPDSPPDLATLASMYGTSATVNETMLAWRRDVWTSRMREIQGSMALASIFEILIGFTGILGFLLRFIGPLCIGPTICLIGLSLYGTAARSCAQHWGIAFMTLALITLFSQYLRNIQFPFPSYNRKKGCHMIRYPILKLLPVFLAIMITWCFCAILTAAGVFPSDPSVIGYAARTDTKLKVLEDAKWFIFPYPGQWGMPTFSAAAVIGIMAGMVAGMLESIGDYHACAQLSEAPPPPLHAINRGIMFEGIGITCAAVWGAGCGVTSYSSNIGAIGITKVASRRVIQVAAVIALLLAMLGKFGALFVTLPQPMIGGIFIALFGMVTAVGVSSLQYVDLNSTRNLFVFGVAVFLGLSVPNWISSNPAAIRTGNNSVDQVFFVLLNTPMLIAGVVGFFLDNTIPGTPEERGLVALRKTKSRANADHDSKSPYDLPFGMNCLRKIKWFRFFPICPTFKLTNDCCTCCPLTKRQASGEQDETLPDRGHVNPVMYKTAV